MSDWVEVAQERDRYREALKMIVAADSAPGLAGRVHEIATWAVYGPGIPGKPKS